MPPAQRQSISRNFSFENPAKNQRHSFNNFARFFGKVVTFITMVNITSVFSYCRG